MSTAIAPMKAFKWATQTDQFTGLSAYDILNEYETDPLQVIKSKLQILLATAKGEWPPDPDFGLPIAQIKQNGNFPDVVAQLIANEILTVQNVSSVALNSDSFDATLRIYTASFTVNTVYGNTSVEVTI